MKKGANRAGRTTLKDGNRRRMRQPANPSRAILREILAKAEVSSVEWPAPAPEVGRTTEPWQLRERFHREKCSQASQPEEVSG
jgi:hypothetical protein